MGKLTFISLLVKKCPDEACFPFPSGARSQTAEQMARVLKFDQVNPDHLHTSFSDLEQHFVGGEDFTLCVANRLYGQEDFPFLKEFVDNTR